jgi:Alw26I/Eco31I/Esp3I family type II restriction endonuclease
MYKIIEHPNYLGMPGARDDEGKIDWTIPSNRKPGSKNWDGNSLRRIWWRDKAMSLGIPIEGKWLSKTAKAIHPFGRKPCQTCGEDAEIAYVYPGAILKKKVIGILGSDDIFRTVNLLNIDSVLEHIYRDVSFEVFEKFLRKEFPIIVPSVDSWPVDLEQIKNLVREKYCLLESNKFSPGAMANPPDRLDGFHTYNLCCRSKEDTGRSSENLRSYTVDRRAFEYWSSGDWVAADLAMGSTGEGVCANCGNHGGISADHIGPISLGFAHTPFFRPLCAACNSAKGNRMSYSDVKSLIGLENKGEEITSPQLKAMWEAIKNRISNDGDALLASKLFRINQDHYFKLLREVVEGEVPDEIMNFLPISFSEYRVEFINFNKETLVFDSIKRTKRQDTYAKTKATRMVRVAFESLRKYTETESRNIQVIDEKFYEESHYELQIAIDLAKQNDPSPLRKELNLAIHRDLSQWDDQSFSNIVNLYKPRGNSEIEVAILKVMADISRVLAERFDRGENVNWGD